MFFSKKLQQFKNIKHCFFSRKNGFSKGIYKSLNCGLGSSDKRGNILKNLKSVSKEIGCKKYLDGDFIKKIQTKRYKEWIKTYGFR